MNEGGTRPDAAGEKRTAGIPRSEKPWKKIQGVGIKSSLKAKNFATSFSFTDLAQLNQYRFWEVCVSSTRIITRTISPDSAILKWPLPVDFSYSTGPFHGEYCTPEVYSSLYTWTL